MTPVRFRIMSRGTKLHSAEDIKLDLHDLCQYNTFVDSVKCLNNATSWILHKFCTRWTNHVYKSLIILNRITFLVLLPLHQWLSPNHVSRWIETVTIVTRFRLTHVPMFSLKELKSWIVIPSCFPHYRLFPRKNPQETGGFSSSCTLLRLILINIPLC